MNKKHYVLFIVKNISCIQFSLCHTSDENFLALNFSELWYYLFILTNNPYKCSPNIITKVTIAITLHLPFSGITYRVQLATQFN